MLRHNKKRNSYIIYEQLLTLATTMAAKGQRDEAAFVLSFIRENFSLNSEIGKEIKLFESLLNKNQYEKEMAIRVLEETLNEAKNISKQRLDEEKTKLIEKINKFISYDLFDIPVRDYKTMASVQILLNELRDSKFDSTPEERVKIKNNLLERMCTKTEIKESDKVDNLTFSLAISKFNKRYSKLMNEDQKHILSAWTNFLITNDENKMKSVLAEKLDKINKCFSKYLSDGKQKNAEYYPMLKEAKAKLKEYNVSLTEESVYEIMRCFDIVEDLQSNEEK